MIQKILLSTTLFFVVTTGTLVGTGNAVLAETCTGTPVDCATKGSEDVGGPSGQQMNLKEAIQTISNVLLFILGAIAVIMIIIGGIRYTTSNGNTQQVESAKNTILYAVIGIAVALIAYALVNFVLGAFGGSGNS